ncbi:hypothetical protein EYF80_009473 [Liparis tanakae]|uniref:Uncharacterized protein n=1 Tax=Liparis tanakae TaxID=230148 RepID=A0A4Z2IRB2_9TELE|nr:hypothetical protein EYF80_009473 [Liparis tanakae]
MSEQTELRRLQFHPSSGSREKTMEMAHITLKAMTAFVFVTMRLYDIGLWMEIEEQTAYRGGEGGDDPGQLEEENVGAVLPVEDVEIQEAVDKNDAAYQIGHSQAAYEVVGRPRSKRLGVQDHAQHHEVLQHRKCSQGERQDGDRKLLTGVRTFLKTCSAPSSRPTASDQLMPRAGSSSSAGPSSCFIKTVKPVGGRVHSDTAVSLVPLDTVGAEATAHSRLYCPRINDNKRDNVS